MLGWQRPRATKISLTMLNTLNVLRRVRGTPRLATVTRTYVTGTNDTTSNKRGAQNILEWFKKTPTHTAPEANQTSTAEVANFLDDLFGACSIFFSQPVGPDSADSDNPIANQWVRGPDNNLRENLVSSITNLKVSSSSCVVNVLGPRLG